jgi:hypothetical protein
MDPLTGLVLGESRKDVTLSPLEVACREKLKLIDEGLGKHLVYQSRAVVNDLLLEIDKVQEDRIEALDG